MSPKADAKRSPKSQAARRAKPVSSWAGVPKQAHEWVSFPDPDYERTWMFDVTFLESNWTCIYGQGCQGVLTGPAPELVQGCCSYGAHFTDAKDARQVEAAAATLSKDQWQFFGRARERGAKKPRVVQRSKSGELTTRVIKGACIFLNRPGFDGGAGCALHRAALERGLKPLKLKPEVCWQLPLRRDDEVGEGGHVTSIIRQWDRRDWGKGGAEFHWWCTESPDAFVGRRAVYEELEDELVEMVGRNIYKRVVAYIRARATRHQSTDRHQSNERRAPASADDRARDAWSPTPVALPHPALRRRTAR